MGKRADLSDAAALLEERYPQLAFLMKVLGEGESSSCLPSDERKGLIDPSSIETIDALYVYGLGLGAAYTHFKEWLEESSQRALIFIEESLAALRLFISSEGAEEIIAHPQVHLRFNLDPKKLAPFALECAAEFPTEQVEVIALYPYKKRFRSRFYRLRSHLLHATTVEHACEMEGSHYHLLTRNFFPNYLRFAGASSGNSLKGRFQDVPAVICGAGPSLAEELEVLRTLDRHALIIAAGSAITALSREGIEPHIALAIDPNFEEYDRFRSSFAFEVPLFYVSRVHPRIFNTCNGTLGYLHTLIGGTAEVWMEKKLGIASPPLDEGFDMEAMSVTTTAIELAYFMGCNPVILAGVDLAFTDQSHYLAGVVGNHKIDIEKRKKETRVSEKLLKRKDRLGNPIYTLVKWTMESGAISRFAAKHPEVKWINVTKGGLGFKSIPYSPLKELSFLRAFDLRGRLLAAMEEGVFNVSVEKIEKALSSLRLSLEKGKEYVAHAYKELSRIDYKRGDPETGRLIFYELELKELEAYQALLKTPLAALEKKDERSLSLPPSLREKWELIEKLISFYLTQISFI